MGVIGIKKKGIEDKMTLVESSLYGKDKTEENLHQLVAENPQLITMEDSEGGRIPMATIGSHLRFPDGEIYLLLMDVEGNLTLVELKRGKTPRDVIAQISELEERWRTR